MSSFSFTGALADALFTEAVGAFPSEACGVVIGRRATPASARFVRFDNLADRLHALDPERYPRDSRTAYVLDPLKLDRMVSEAQERGEDLLAIVHSHPQYPAYFSATDRAAASPFGFPSYPDAAQVVVSVFDGVVRDLKAFAWDNTTEDWLELPVTGLPPLPGPPPGAHRLEEE